MAETKLAVVPSPTTVGTTIKALLQSHLALSRAAAALQIQTKNLLDANVDAFAAAPLKLDDAVKFSGERETKKAALTAQAAALVYWAGEVDARLAGLAEHFSTDVVQALDTELALLEDQRQAEQGQVQDVEAFIADFQALRALLLKPEAAAASKPAARATTKRS